MPTLIKDGQVAENDWQRVDSADDLGEALASPAEKLLVSLALWNDHSTELGSSGKTIGVWLDSEEDPYALPDTVAELPLIALNFPVFRDGRPFSAAAIIRERLGFRGELRAIGDVLRDQLFYMKRCGFDSFEISDEANVEEALSAFNDFTDSYQSTVEEPKPLFQRK